MKASQVYEVDLKIHIVSILNDLDGQKPIEVNYLIFPDYLMRENGGNLELIKKDSKEYELVLVSTLNHLRGIPVASQPALIQSWLSDKKMALSGGRSTMMGTLTAKKREDDGTTTTEQENQGT